MEDLARLERKRQALEEKIRETKQRLPAHSTNPPIMMELLALEDEYDQLLKTIRQIKS